MFDFFKRKNFKFLDDSAEKQYITREEIKYRIDGKIVIDIITTLTNIVEKYGPDTRLNIDTVNYGDCSFASVNVMSPETDAEYTMRMLHIAQRDKYKQEQELNTFKKLNKKYGNK